ncbi:ESPR domain-containing protein [Escherichia coli]|uniref:ESPR domain-containing protein n=1 Tax=Escherichia coli TaxID=562 RepID=UPI003D36A45A
MNKIYSLKYSAATGGLIAVSELAKRVSGKTNRKLVATMLSLAVAGTVNAANIDISNVWARDYLERTLRPQKLRFTLSLLTRLLTEEIPMILRFRG